jgi:hypothetical protein
MYDLRMCSHSIEMLQARFTLLQCTSHEGAIMGVAFIHLKIITNVHVLNFSGIWLDSILLFVWRNRIQYKNGARVIIHSSGNEVYIGTTG